MATTLLTHRNSLTSQRPGSALLVGNFLSASTSSRGVCEDLADRLRQAGWQLTTTSSHLPRLKRIADMMRTAWSERDRYEVAHVDVFSGPAFAWAEAVCWVLRAANKPYALTLHGGNLPSFAERQGPRVGRLLRSAAAVTAPSRFLQRAVQAYRTDVLLLPNALDLTLYPFRHRTVARPEIIWLRAFHSIYNPSLAPRMLAHLKARCPQARLTMIGRDKGDGSYQAAVRAATSAGVSSAVDFVPGIGKTEVPERLQRAGIFINTTNVDNTPVSVLEAMACGLCVVSTNVGGIPDLLTHEHDALLVPPDDPIAMADAVERLAGDSALASRLSRNARATASRFDWSKILPEWEQLLHSLRKKCLV